METSTIASGLLRFRTLQWGHRLSAMETLEQLSKNVDKLSLQWGHRLSAMETWWRTQTAWSRRKCFNGATAFRRWKRALNGRRYAGRHHASMVPPPFGDGSSRGRAGWCRRAISFNGATAFRRWKPHPIPPVPCAYQCFNGATAFRRWKQLLMRPEGDFRSALQWGHRLSAMKTAWNRRLTAAQG